MQRARDGCRVLSADQQSRAATQKLDGVREAGRHDWLTRGHGLNKDSRGDLLQRVIRQQHDIRAANQLSESGRWKKPGVEVHAICHIPVPCSRHQRQTVSLAVAVQHARMSLAGYLIVGKQPATAKHGHCIDRVLDTLAWSKQPPGQHPWPADGPRR